MFDGDRPAKTVATRLAVPHFIFVIVIPGGIDAHFQQLLSHALLPPVHCRRVGEVQM